jgi:hypothetical protein
MNCYKILIILYYVTLYRIILVILLFKILIRKMRAKEYIAHHLGELKYIYEIRVVINNLLPLRSNKKKTDECANRMLYADQRRKQYLYMKELYEQGNPMAKEEPKLGFIRQIV